MKLYLTSLVLLFSAQISLATCPFEGLYIYELKDDPRFEVSAEEKATITRGLFWANEDFFRQFNKKGCRGAYRKADVTFLPTGESFTYYKTVLDECDGGNTVGVIVPQGRHKALAEIGDSEIRCYR